MLVLRPALADRSQESRRDFFLSLKIRLKMLVHGGIAGTLISGLYNIHLGWRANLAPNLEVFLAKLVLALAVLALVIAALAGRFTRFRPALSAKPPADLGSYCGTGGGGRLGLSRFPAFLIGPARFGPLAAGDPRVPAPGTAVGGVA